MTDGTDPRREVDQIERDLRELAFAASHDLQAPIWHVRGFLELLLRHLVDDMGVELDETCGQYRDFATGALERLQRMIDGLLEYSRITTRANPFEKVDLTEATRRAVESLAPSLDEANAKLEVAALPVVEGDAAQLSQLMGHLIANAIAFRSTERRLRIDVEADDTGDTCELRVRDTGQGIDGDEVGRVLGLLQRNHADDEPGSGMGLAVCRRIVERHGGDIRIVSDVSVGTTVIVTIPTVREQQPQVP